MKLTATKQMMTPEATIASTFVRGGDGFWYPDLPGVPLVRVKLARGFYRIERRRSPDTVWLLLVESDLAQFDPDAFDTWRANWPMVQER